MTTRHVAAEACQSIGAAAQVFESYPGREISLGDLAVTRLLPVRDRRLIGPWCFLDRFGPLSFSEGRPMDVAPHPHIGLQTVSWLLQGEIAHDDSLGCAGLLRPGGVNVMTSGRGIAHAEQTPQDHTGRLQGVQLWVALPDAERERAPGFEAVAEVPRVEQPGGVLQVFAGACGDARSPAPHFSPIVGVDIALHPRGTMALPLDPSFEHALVVLDGDATIEGEVLDPGQLYYLGRHRTTIDATSRGGGRTLLIGGLPFAGPILMWWNFVARTPEEIAQAREDWMAHRRFGEVTAYQGPRLDAPSLLRFARANAVS
jgi:redox-sensitive bicupin YhaK (pirin superfamily)